MRQDVDARLAFIFHQSAQIVFHYGRPLLATGDCAVMRRDTSDNVNHADTFMALLPWVLMVS